MVVIANEEETSITWWTKGMCIFCAGPTQDTAFSNRRSDAEVLAAEHCPNLALRVPATIISGFLGAGKTTLVNWLLQGSHGRRICVLQNEFGSVSVDDALIVRSQRFADVAVLTLSTGCVCCKVRGDLVEGLQTLARCALTESAGSESGGHFDAIIVETSGLAEVRPVAQTFFADKFVQRNFRLDAVLTVVDAQTAPAAIQLAQAASDERLETEAMVLKGGDSSDSDAASSASDDGIACVPDDSDDVLRLQAAQLLCEQICLADVILLNKVDLVSEEACRDATALLASVNTLARIIPTRRARADLGSIVDLRAFSLERALAVDDSFLRDGQADGHIDARNGLASRASKPGSAAFAFARQQRSRSTQSPGGADAADAYAYAGGRGEGSQTPRQTHHQTQLSSQFTSVGKTHLHSQFTSVGLESTRDLDELSFNDWLESALRVHASRLIRAKGVLFFAGSDEPTAVQCVGAHVECERIPLNSIDPAVAKRRRSRFVLIGRTSGIEQELKKGFAAV